VNLPDNNPPPPPLPPKEQVKDKEPPKQSQRELIEQAVNHLSMELIQLRRTLWLAVQACGGRVEIDETKCHPLWSMKFTRLSPTAIAIESSQMPDPTPEQLKELADKLAGSMTEVREAVKGTALEQYNPVYLTMLIRNLVVRNEQNYWVDAEFVK
jgi:hypothetical protein